MMDTTTFIDPAVVGFAKNFVFAKVNGHVDSLLERNVGISGHPTVILFAPDGQEVDRLLGYFPADTFMLELNNYLAGKNTLADYLSRVAAAPNDPQLHYTLADKWTARSKYAEARTHYNKVLELDPENKLGLNDDASYYLAFLCRKEKNFLKAIDGFRAMIKAYPASELREDAETYIPWLYAQAGDSAQALKYYKEFLVNFPASKETEWVTEQIQKIEHPGDSTKTE
jgi:tetratricopeptide (TPR) repeat protein